jgi:thymidine phosphorylase
MLPQEIIRIKRDGGRLSEEQIQRFIQGVTSGAVTEGQIAAFCMAVFFRGMEMDERVALTLAMTRSGTVLDWKPLNLPGPILDKHSTGGVGDKVSLILAPAIAACGGFVPMISGRGLGHTGGTLDKLDSIPGYVSLPDRPTLERVIRDVGCAIIGATDAFAPADKRVYAVRDITATVESLDLITASILSKKLAAGLDALVMDVKFGSGAFMPTYEDSVALAESIVTVATGAGMPTVALLTDMNEVLGRTAGNALEVRESIDFLTGAAHDPRLYEVTAALSAELLVLGGLCPDQSTARTRFDEAISSGAAAERFGRMVASLGGPADLLENPDRYLAAAPVKLEVHATAPGHVTAIDTRALGVAVVALGGGRTRVQDPIDPAVGLSHVASLGTPAGPQCRPLAIVHARSKDAAQAAADAIRSAFTIGDSAPAPTPPVARRLAH